MPVWVQVILGAAAVVTALGVIHAKLLRPAWRFAKATDELVPLLRDLTTAFRGTPDVFLVLSEIAAEFRTDSGSSLRDVVNRLEAALKAAGITIEAAAQLAAEDRQALARVLVLLNAADLGRVKVAADLSTAQDAVDAVAEDLAAGHARADAVGSDDHGAAADAASRTAPPES